MGRYRDILLMYIDIDQLRVINEEYGRAAGDEMVVISARCVENVSGKRNLLPHRRG